MLPDSSIERSRVAPPGKAKPRKRRWLAVLLAGLLLLALGYLAQYYFFSGADAPKFDIPTKKSIEQAVARVTVDSTAELQASNTLNNAQENSPAVEVKGFPDAPFVVDEPPSTLPTPAANTEASALPPESDEIANVGSAAAPASVVEIAEPEPIDEERTQETLQEHTFLISFSFDSDELIPDSHHVLDSALVMLRENPDSVASITGFTDNRGDRLYNLDLSMKRAIAVQQYLVNAGIAQERLNVEGRGVLTDPVQVGEAVAEDPTKQYRIVQIKVSGNQTL